jgi:hypothetical protein
MRQARRLRRYSLFRVRVGSPYSSRYFSASCPTFIVSSAASWLGTSSSSRALARARAVVLVIVPPSCARAPCPRSVGMTASSPVEDKARAEETRHFDLTTHLRSAASRRRGAPRATCRAASRRGRQRPRRADARDLGAALLGAHGGGCGRARRVFGIVVFTGGKRGPARETGQEIVTDLTSPIDRGRACLVFRQQNIAPRCTRGRRERQREGTVWRTHSTPEDRAEARAPRDSHEGRHLADVPIAHRDHRRRRPRLRRTSSASWPTLLNDDFDELMSLAGRVLRGRRRRSSRPTQHAGVPAHRRERKLSARTS